MTDLVNAQMYDETLTIAADVSGPDQVRDDWKQRVTRRYLMMGGIMKHLVFSQVTDNGRPVSCKAVGMIDPSKRIRHLP